MLNNIKRVFHILVNVRTFASVTLSKKLNPKEYGKIVNKLTELIGNTPLLALNKFSAERGLKTPVLAKVEYFNPGGSVKDRISIGDDRGC